MSDSIQLFETSLRSFSEFGTTTKYEELEYGDLIVPTYINEFWTSKQRDAHSLHEVSYRACFKPQLPRFFIEKLTHEGDLVFDPFMGRGTTLIESALLGRIPSGNDVNPLSIALNLPRLDPPELSDIEHRLNELDLSWESEIREDLLVFYHEKTLREIHALRAYFLQNAKGNDRVDQWIRMVAINRLTGHSKGFFSVYSMPPNQAVSVKSQKRINERKNQTPEYHEVKPRILKKSKQLLKDLINPERDQLKDTFGRSFLTNEKADNLIGVEDNCVSLVVTSPPFLDVIDYTLDNWLRCWFLGVNSSDVPIWQLRKIETWEEAMSRTLCELKRILKPGGTIAFEVGEVRHGEIKLENHVVKCAVKAGLKPELIMINVQEFTKTAACWGVENSKKGTNSNRIVVLRKS